MRRFPFRLRVTVLAAPSESAAMRVIGGMAAAARVAHSGPFVQRGGVAARALEIGMRTLQREVGLALVVEPPEAPTIRVVAASAILAERLFVNVFLSVTGPAFGVAGTKRRILVAGFAGGGRVETEQRKARQVMFEAHPSGEGHFVVAVRAVRPEASGVHVIGTVAVDAVRSLVFPAIGGLGVTGVAGRSGVGPAEREIGLFSVIELRWTPGRRAVASPAVGPKTPRVKIVLGMAAAAVLGQRPLARGFDVATCAVDFAVDPVEREAALCKMVERALIPGRGRMAVRAVRSEAPRMAVIDRVAGDAFARGLRVVLGNMAAPAARFLMGPGQRVVGRVVVELAGLPGDFIVTFSAVLGKPTFVGIVLSVAVDAGAGRVPSRSLRAVAIRAPRGFVLPAKRVVRLAVVESRFAQPCDVGVASLVVWMAVSALAGLRECVQVVKARLVLEITGDVFMTHETERSLLRGVESLVTGRAVFLEFEMSAGEWAGHHHALPVHRLTRPGEAQYEEAEQAREQCRRGEARERVVEAESLHQ